MKETGINTHRLDFLNILRFIAAISVFTLHFSLANYDTNTFVFYGFICKLGGVAVPFFFVVSGVLFYLFYYGKIVDNKMSVKSFVINRFFRLFVPAFLSLSLLFALNGIAKSVTGYTYRNLPLEPFNIISCLSLLFGPAITKNAFGANGSWYITILLWCYILCFAISKIKCKKQSLHFILFGILLLLGISMIYTNFNYPFFNTKFGIGLYNFDLGILVGLILSKLKNNNVSNFLKIVCLVSFLSTFIVFCLNYLKHEQILLPFFCFVPLILCLADLKLVNKFSSNIVFKTLGSISFDIYLLHQSICTVPFIIIRKFNFNLDNQIWFYLLMLLIVTLFAYVANKGISSKFTHLSHRFSNTHKN